MHHFLRGLVRLAKGRFLATEANKELNRGVQGTACVKSKHFAFWLSPLCEVRTGEIMKIGEIKLQAMSLIFPSTQLDYASDNVSDAIFRLKSNPNYSAHLSATTGAINRALSIIEARRLTELDEIELDKASGEVNGDLLCFALKDEVFSICQVISGGIEIDFRHRFDKLYVRRGSVRGSLKVRYFTKIERLCGESDDNEELPLNESIAEQIPYFVKADLLLCESPEESRESREIFFKALDSFFTEEALQKTTYSQEVIW